MLSSKFTRIYLLHSHQHQSFQQKWSFFSVQSSTINKPLKVHFFLLSSWLHSLELLQHGELLTLCIFSSLSSTLPAFFSPPEIKRAQNKIKFFPLWLVPSFAGEFCALSRKRRVNKYLAKKEMKSQIN